LFVSLSGCAADQAGRSRSQTAGATRRCSSDLEKSMPRSHHLLCASVVDSPAAIFQEEISNGEQSLIDELMRFSNCARGEDTGASQLKICRGRPELGKAITNSTYKMAYVMSYSRKENYAR
jgi:hypothetical protein